MPRRYQTTCSVDGCKEKFFAKKFCSLHYQRFHRNGDPLKKYKVIPISILICDVSGCGKPGESKFSNEIFCAAHVQRIRRWGDPFYTTPEEIRRANNRVAQKTFGKRQPHTYVKLNGRHEHRVVMEKIVGRKLSKDEVVHHIDGNKHNNDPSNLQLMSQSEHMRIHGHDLIMAQKQRQAERRPKTTSKPVEDWEE